ncbi:protein phosphatase 2C domain-containing protein [Streptacidiphilus rugosus]|uniref:protein phosphatase 2C domain-containing protein n=1 Tax=Streptacidiphilus rugosus TaxID=405783 RepID=UPI0005668AA3|nr:protein phosphatase 2C domain-containing protein [Streptacidiphilus rugosus]
MGEATLAGDGWQAVTAGARGAAHAAAGRPSQDAARAARGHDGAAVVAVADGHGHPQHFRSEAGAVLAVDAACSQGLRRLPALLAAAAQEPQPAVRRDFVPQLVEHWRAAVAGHLSQHPYTEPPADPLVPYGTTLVLAAVCPPWLLCLQIGDGDLLVVRRDGSSFAPVPQDRLLDGGRTTSLCQPDAAESVRIAAVDLRGADVALVLLATDGYGNAQREDLWQPQVGADLAALAAEHGPDWFAAQLPLWAELCASGAGSGDDTTIALLLHLSVTPERRSPWTS